jgi:hypothetical protein
LSCHHQEAKKKKLTIVRFSSKFLGYSQTRIAGSSDMRADPNFLAYCATDHELTQRHL